TLNGSRVNSVKAQNYALIELVQSASGSQPITGKLCFAGSQLGQTPQSSRLVLSSSVTRARSCLGAQMVIGGAIVVMVRVSSSRVGFRWRKDMVEETLRSMFGCHWPTWCQLS
ncbi:unnamed protein product, partial [Mycena citricolor]